MKSSLRILTLKTKILMALTDAEAMNLALRRAKRGQGQTDDNQVLDVSSSQNGRDLALSHTVPGGRPMRKLRPSHGWIKGAKQPSGYFRTLRSSWPLGPCTDALIKAGVFGYCWHKRCQSKVSGKGLAKLRAAGIEVQS